ncbi:MAG: antitoxin [Candidatus Firestonebacteria bacterium]|nr:antitoxin [Candidatus Firestonebacteria bacterium]
MNTITVRGIDNEVSKALKEKAKEERTSVNSIILEVIKEALGLKKRKAIYHDLDHLAGTWNEKDFKDFQNKITDFETIDENMWK